MQCTMSSDFVKKFSWAQSVSAGICLVSLELCLNTNRSKPPFFNKTMVACFWFHQSKKTVVVTTTLRHLSDCTRL